MSRFKKEISGELGEFWQRNAQKEVDEALKKLAEGEMIIESDGAVKWKESGNYVPDDYMEKLEYGGAEGISREATKIKADIQAEEAIMEYRERMKNHKYSAEELYEMRAAFGEGETIVDVFTDEEITL